MTSLLREPLRLPAAPGRFPSRESSSPLSPPDSARARGPSRPLAFSRPNPNTFASPYFKDERVDLWLERGKPNGASDRRGYKLSCFSMPFFRARENRHAGARLREGKQASRSSRRDRFGFREAEGGADAEEADYRLLTDLRSDKFHRQFHSKEITSKARRRGRRRS